MAAGLEAIDEAAISMEAVVVKAADYTVAITVVATIAEGNCLKVDSCFEEVGFHHRRHFRFHS